MTLIEFLTIETIWGFFGYVTLFASSFLVGCIAYERHQLKRYMCDYTFDHTIDEDDEPTAPF